MKIITNHFNLSPEVKLTENISAIEIIKPETKGQMSAHKIWVPENIEYPPHTHPSAHIIVVLEGGGYVKLTKNKNIISENINPGDMFFVPENIPHQVGADKRGLIMLAISVNSKELTDPDRLKIIDGLL